MKSYLLMSGALVLAFPSEALTAAVTPGHLFAQAVARNLRQKSHIFTSLEAFTTLVRDGEKTGSIDIGALRDRFTLIDSALHPVRARVVDRVCVCLCVCVFVCVRFDW